MKIKKGNIRLNVDENKVEGYLKSGWVKVQEVKPDLAHKYYLEQKRKKELKNYGNDESETN